jgi:predicted DNA-binding protein with PD1-like motif
MVLKAMGATDGFVRLADGESLVDELLKLPLSSAVILCGIGMVRDLELGYWNGEAYVPTRISEPVELLSLQGSIARHGAGRALHAHICVAGEDGVARGGHLMSATVHNTAEIALRTQPGIVLERVEEETGVLGLHPRLENEL